MIKSGCLRRDPAKREPRDIVAVGLLVLLVFAAGVSAEGIEYRMTNFEIRNSLFDIHYSISQVAKSAGDKPHRVMPVSAR